MDMIDNNFPPKRRPQETYVLPVSGLDEYAADSSAEGAAKIAPFVDTARERVFRCVLESGERGMTDREIQAALNMKENTQRPRRVELWQERRIRYKRDADGQLAFRVHGVRVKEFVWVVGSEYVCPHCGSVPSKTYVPEK
jgi:hypothetical protein